LKRVSAQKVILYWGVGQVSGKLTIIIAILIAAALITISFFVDDIMPFAYVASALNLITIIAYAASNKKKSEK